MKTVQPGDDEKFAATLQNILTVANANLDVLNLTANDLAPLQTSQETLRTKIAASIAQRAAAFASTIERRNARTSAATNLRLLQSKIKTNPALPPQLATQLGIKSNSGRTQSLTPQTPADLVVTPDVNGTNTLRWKAGGNKRGAIYVVEARVGSATEFTFVNNSTRLSFAHTGQSLGISVSYRVKAQRNDKVSAYSNEAVAYNSVVTLRLTDADEDTPRLRAA